MFPVELVREIHRRVKLIRHRMESPRLPTDLFGHDAPSAEELAKIRQTVERLLTTHRRKRFHGFGVGQHGYNEEEDEEEDVDGMSLLEGSSMTGSRPSSPAPPGQAGRPPPQATTAPRASSFNGAAAANINGPVTDLAFLIKLESMLSLEGGVDLVDQEMANWLGALLV